MAPRTRNAPSLRKAAARGTATVEMAVAAPVLCLLLLTGAELGRAFVQYSILSNAVRQSLRFVSEDNSINGLTGVVYLSGATITSTQNLAVYGNVAGTGTPRLPGFTTGNVQVQSSGGTDIRVTATYAYQPMIGATLPSFGTGAAIPLGFTMRIDLTMRAIS